MKCITCKFFEYDNLEGYYCDLSLEELTVDSEYTGYCLRDEALIEDEEYRREDEWVSKRAKILESKIDTLDDSEEDFEKYMDIVEELEMIDPWNLILHTGCRSYPCCEEYGHCIED